MTSTIGTNRLARVVSPDHAIGRALLTARARMDLATWRPRDATDRALKGAIGLVTPSHTMVAVPRLRRLAALATGVHRSQVPGAVVECGVWRGGALALLDWLFRSFGDSRTVWGFDSFEGLPVPGPNDPASVHRAFFQGWCAASPDDVRAAVEVLGGSTDRIRLVTGWLHDTLPRTSTGPIAFLHVDVDWYDSVTLVLDTLFDRMAPGGIVSIDDYGRWEGCDGAVRDFMTRRALPREMLRRAGRYGAWLQVPLPPRESTTASFPAT